MRSCAVSTRAGIHPLCHQELRKGVQVALSVRPVDGVFQPNLHDQVHIMRGMHSHYDCDFWSLLTSSADIPFLAVRPGISFSSVHRFCEACVQDMVQDR